MAYFLERNDMHQPTEQFRIHPIEEELHAIEGYKTLKFSSRIAIFQKIDEARKAARPLTERITDMALMEALSPPTPPNQQLIDDVKRLRKKLVATRDWLQMHYVDGVSHPSLGDAIISLNAELIATDRPEYAEG